MELKERISKYTPLKYNRFFWWRRFKGRETLHPYQPLRSRIENGDFEVSDYHWWYLWECELEKEALAKEKCPEKQHELRGLFGERKRRLLNDFEKDEEKIKTDMYKAFWVELGISRDKLEELMLEFEGGLAEFYYHIYDKRQTKWK